MANRIPVDTVSLSLLRRIQFFARGEIIPLLFAPLLVRFVWAEWEVGNVVFSYPGLPYHRALAAKDLLEAGCESVLLRSSSHPPIVAALARNFATERLVHHWADAIERFIGKGNRYGMTDSLDGGRMVQELCDAVGSLRLEPTDRIVFPDVSANHDLPEIARQAIESLVIESLELFNDPVGNAAAVLNSPEPGFNLEPDHLVTKLMAFIRSARRDLQDAFDLSLPTGRQGFVDWFLERAAIEFDLGETFTGPVLRAREVLAAKAHELRQIPPRLEPVPSGPGFNLIGYPRAEMGMGEQLRGCAGALECAKIPFGIIDFQHGLVASNRDSRYERLIRDQQLFDINLFHINADQMPLAFEKLGPSFFRNHYNIGYWEWELSRFPEEWLRSIDLMDEIWAPSTFIAGTISKETAKPVVWMPLAIEFPKPATSISDRASRAGFGIPADPFLFLFAFDFSSFSTRKNYWAAIDAFKQAFDSGNDSAGLVLKTIRHERHHREFLDLLRYAGNDPRIHIIDRVLRKTEMRDLIASCDALLSLHRSEGFGLAIAEAMYLGKPVVATNYSGNVDFTKEDNSCLIDCQLIPVKPGEYVFPEDQVWADADVRQAALRMRQLVDDPELCKGLGEAAARFMRQQHSLRAVGQRYADRLHQIHTAKTLLAAPSGDSYASRTLSDRVKVFSRALFK